jgi:hypothetical protein
MLTETLLKIPFSVIGPSSLMSTSHWMQGKLARFKVSQAASGIILQNRRRLFEYICGVKISGLGPPKRVTVRFSKLVNNFKGAS